MHGAASYDVQDHGNTVLTVHVHEGYTASDPADTAHPWHELLEQPGVEPTEAHPANACTAQNTVLAPPHTLASTEDITSQGLLDGLEELYDFADGAANTSGTATDAVASTENSIGDGPALTEPGAMDPDDADAIISQMGDFESAQQSLLEHTSEPDAPAKMVPAKKPADGSNAEETMDDMSDAEAKRIVGALGGFSRPSEASASGKASSLGGADTALDGMADMDDTEAQNIIRSYGGFSKPVAVRKQQSSPSKDIHAASPALAQQAIATPEAATPKTASPFPSKSDVLSARRALKNEGSGRGAPLSSLRRPAGMRVSAAAASGLRSPSPSPSPAAAAGSVRRAELAASPRRQLAFKLPSLLKRTAPSQRFNSPVKRLAVGGTQTSLEPGASGEANGGGAAVRLVQFSQPFRSPARAAPGQRALPQSRPPPVLPPVTSRTPAPAATPTGPTRAADAGVRQQRLSSVGALLDVGSIGDVPPDAVNMTSEAAAAYRFPKGPTGVTSEAAGWGADDAQRALAAHGCVEGAVPLRWVRNHFRWIVWGSASYARRLPTRWREFWAAEHVLARLLRRYEREYVRGERPALRRVLEGDSAPQQLMVLCVAAVRPLRDAGTDAAGTDSAGTDSAGTGSAGGKRGQEADGSPGVYVEVTDGWYSVQARVDSVLEAAIRSGRLRAGDKIACAGLRLDGLPEASEPLEAVAAGARLLLTGNSVRRAAWDATLGFQRRRAFFMSLAAVHAGGGSIGATLDVVVVRRYPTLFMETLQDGQRVVRSEREEERVGLAFGERRAARMQELLERRGMDGGGEAAFMRTEAEAIARSEAVAEAVDAELPPRQVSALFRMRVCDYPAHASRSSTATNTLSRQAQVTVWRANGFAPDEPREGSRLLISGASVSRFRGHSLNTHLLQLSVGSGAFMRPARSDPQTIARSAYLARQTLRVDELEHAVGAQEIDVTGAVDAYRSGDLSMLRLRCSGSSSSSSSDGGFAAEIEFPGSVFGRVAPLEGAVAIVRNCRVVQAMSGGVVRLRADDTAEFVIR